MANFNEVDSIGQFSIHNRYRFTYNDKPRLVEVMQIMEGDNRKHGGNADYIQCLVLEDDSEKMTEETFKRFTIAKIQGPIVKVAIE